MHHGAKLFGKQRRQHIALKGSDIDIERRTPGKGHFAQGDQQATVGAIVIGEQQVLLQTVLHGCEEAAERRGIVDIGNAIAHLAMDLRQSRPAEAVATAAEIDQHQQGIGHLTTDLWCHGKTHIAHRRERRNDQ